MFQKSIEIKGLSSAEALQRLQKYGPNKLAGKQKEPGWQAFLRSIWHWVPLAWID